MPFLAGTAGLRNAAAWDLIGVVIDFMLLADVAADVAKLLLMFSESIEPLLAIFLMKRFV